MKCRRRNLNRLTGPDIGYWDRQAQALRTPTGSTKGSSKNGISARAARRQGAKNAARAQKMAASSDNVVDKAIKLQHDIDTDDTTDGPRYERVGVNFREIADE